MSTDVTMQELELETAELLPARETLWSGGGSTRSFSSQHHLPERQQRQRRRQRAGPAALILFGHQRRPYANGNRAATRHLLAPARLTQLACALPEGDARPAREGRPAAAPPGRPSRLRRPGPGRSRAGPFGACEGGAARDRSRRARDHRAPGTRPAPGGCARARSGRPGWPRGSSCSASTRVPATASRRRWCGGPTARSSRCRRCCTRWPAGSTAPAARPPSPALVSGDLGRSLTADQVRYLITAKLLPLGIVAADGHPGRPAEGQPAVRAAGRGARCCPSAR